ncbi:MAG TPA: transposase domain-containing protein [Polyangiaceae bacterium]|nr:transposase domain-containing protein [Polyangiaceae bacterium]
MGRRNWNFIGNEKGGWTAAILFSLVETAKTAGVDPKTYLEDVLLRVGTEEDVSSLTPHGWKERWEPKVKAHRQDLLERLMGRAGAGKWLRPRDWSRIPGGASCNAYGPDSRRRANGAVPAYPVESPKVLGLHRLGLPRDS